MTLLRHRRKSSKKRGRQRKSRDAEQTTRTPDLKPPSATILSKRNIWMAALATVTSAVSIGLAFQFLAVEPRSISSGNAPSDIVAGATFVGSETCAACHRTEAELWRSSQHRLAMDHATDTSVLGDFNDASFDYYGVHSRFFRQDGKFFVETDGPDGKRAQRRRPKPKRQRIGYWKGLGSACNFAQRSRPPK